MPASAPAGLDLSELERDALTELVNIGVSRAAASLRKMVGRQVLLSVPEAEVVSRRTAARLIGQREAETLVAVRQDFSGAFSGRALLIFPEGRSLELVRAVVGEALGEAEMRGLEDEALAETGNVILNGCLATMANMLRESLTMSLPEVLRGDGSLLFELEQEEAADGLVLFLYINFAVLERDIHGYIAMLMDLPSLAALKLLVGDFIARVMGPDGEEAGDAG
ncbi:chemotaxis protein CheX [Pseudoroseomonas deserti]|uniref:Chemotaxis protein CheX n=1 Tax=Teichococcus deserti TaxID=1817963 RepID=A0A1V2H6N4_9PROT|nr:chemotaxis protein CheX [Pseudoroseomonas deserti]ONG56747.1 chemotaxis protein CheX [Pseudoroseomonas deserti]